MAKTDPRTILYIEDDLEMINLVTIILNRSGFVVKSANCGSKGLELIEQELPDLILLDLMMPEMDGWTLYQQLKSRESTSDIPVIVITAKSLPIDRVLGLYVAKVDDYIAKPFHPQELLTSIHHVLESKAGKQK